MNTIFLSCVLLAQQISTGSPLKRDATSKADKYNNVSTWKRVKVIIFLFVRIYESQWKCVTCWKTKKSAWKIYSVICTSGRKDLWNNIYKSDKLSGSECMGPDDHMSRGVKETLRVYFGLLVVFSCWFASSSLVVVATLVWFMMLARFTCQT